MADRLTPEQRRRCMAAIRSKDTGPELIVRRAVHALKRRFRLHRGDLPGCPDLVLPRDRKAIFVHGCFWHAHSCRAGARTPATNADFWAKKRAGNIERDIRVQHELRKLGWMILTVWECELKQPDFLDSALHGFLGLAHDPQPVSSAVRKSVPPQRSRRP